MAAARVGEQMKCRVRGQAAHVLWMSLGVIRIRGVRYSKLDMHVSYQLKLNSGKEIVPAVFSAIGIEGPGRSMVLITEYPHLWPVFV